MSILINKKSIAFGEILLLTLAILAFAIVVMPKKVSAECSYYNDAGCDDGYDHFLSTSKNPIPIAYSISPKSANSGDNVSTVAITGSGFTPNSVARWNGQNRTTTFIDREHVLIHLNASDLNSKGGYINVYNPNRQAYSQAYYFKVKGYVAGISNTNNNTNNSYNNGNYNNGNNGNNNYQNTDQTGNQNNGSNGYNNNGSNSNSGQDVSSLASGAIFGSNSFAPSGIIQWVLFAIAILLIVIIVRKFFGGADRYHNTPLKHA